MSYLEENTNYDEFNDEEMILMAKSEQNNGAKDFFCIYNLDVVITWLE